MSSGFPDWQGIQQWFGASLAVQSNLAVGAGVHTDGPFQVASWASVILWASATAQQVTFTITQTVADGPAALTSVTTVVVPAGQTKQQAVVLLGDTVTLTVQGAAVGAVTSYALVPSNTTSATTVVSGVATASVAKAHATIATVCANAVATQVLLTTLDTNTDGYSINNGSIYVPRTGYYDATALAQWASAAGGYREVGIWIVNAAGAQVGVVAFIDVPTIGAVGFHYIGITPKVIEVAAGQGLGLWGLQTSGGALNLNAGSAQFPHLAVSYLGS